MYLTWQKGNGEWNQTNSNPNDHSRFDVWGPFDNVVQLKLKEYELRGLMICGFDPIRQMQNEGFVMA